MNRKQFSRTKNLTILISALSKLQIPASISPKYDILVNGFKISF